LDLHHPADKAERGEDMGTILFILARLIGKIDAPNDLLMLCFLISLDSIALASFLKKE
jgi:hypothetical protein